MTRRVTLVLVPLGLLAALALLALPASAADTTIRNGHEAPTGQCTSTNQPYTYEPSSVAIDPGDTITFTNPRVHNNGCQAAEHPTKCRASAGTCPFGQEDLPPGGSFQVTFDAEGTFSFQCLAHPYMEGTITVGDGDPSAPQPTQEPTSEPEPTQEPTSEPEPTQEPTSEPLATQQPTSEPEPTQEPTSEPEATQQPTTDEPSEEPSDPPTQTTDVTDEPSDDASEAEAGEVRVDPPGSSGTGAKAVATILVLGTGGALWSVSRGR